MLFTIDPIFERTRCFNTVENPVESVEYYLYIDLRIIIMLIKKIH